MRTFGSVAIALATAVPLVSFAPAAHGDNDLMGQAQRFLNNNNRDGDRDAYERGRDDELRRQQAQRDRDRDRYRRDDARDWSRDDDRYRGPGYR